MDFKKIRGFNYQPSYGSTSYENWLYFNPSMVEIELGRGKTYFSNFSVVRYWLSRDAYLRGPDQFIKNFEIGLQIADRLGIKVLPCLFNRWHDREIDCGGIYIDHFMPCGDSFLYRENNFDQYVTDVVSNHVNDYRILCWDVCNEPFPYMNIKEIPPDLVQYEYTWLERIYNKIKSIDNNTLVGVSIHAADREGMIKIEPISDILLFHPYYVPDKMDLSIFIEMVEGYKNFSISVNKPLLATETCWGAVDDAERVEIIKTTLEILKRYEVGFLAHALHYSKVADLHTIEDGPVGFSGNLAFTNSDGTLRAGHDIFNNY